jgi:urease accessory protein
METGIALSVLVLGLAAAVNAGVATALAVALSGLFAVFHGVAHGTEIPDAASGLAYSGGFLTATALLHAGGIGMSLGVSRLGPEARLLPRAAAGSIALLGVGLLTGMI